MMKIKHLNYDTRQFPNVLTIYIDGAPHYRQSKTVIEKFRKNIWQAWLDAGYCLPIDVPIDLHVLFINPTSPDLPNVLMALSRALDGKTLRGKAILTDDGLISEVIMRKFYPSEPTRSENRVP